MSARSWIAVVAALITLVACGDDGGGGVTTGPGVTTGNGVPPTDLECEDRVSAHGDPEPGFVGVDTAEEAAATSRLGSLGTIHPLGGDRWLVEHDGEAVAIITVSEAPGGGFAAFDEEVCAEFWDLAESGALGLGGGEGFVVDGLGAHGRSIVLACEQPQIIDFTPLAGQDLPDEPFSAAVATLTGSPPGWSEAFVGDLGLEMVEPDSSDDPTYLYASDPDGAIIALMETLEYEPGDWSVHVLTYCEQ
jgi:hypothetical protein